MKKKYFFAGILFLFSAAALQAQQSVNTVGGDATGSGGTTAFSIGQISNQTVGSSTTVATGVQQPYEISIISSLSEIHQLNLEIRVFPNPATDYITLEIEDFANKNLNYQLVDMKGAILEKATLIQNKHTINMNGRSAATYFLRVADQDQNFQTFKIIKSN